MEQSVVQVSTTVDQQGSAAFQVSSQLSKAGHHQAKNQASSRGEEPGVVQRLRWRRRIPAGPPFVTVEIVKGVLQSGKAGQDNAEVMRTPFIGTEDEKQLLGIRRADKSHKITAWQVATSIVTVELSYKII